MSETAMIAAWFKVCSQELCQFLQKSLPESGFREYPFDKCLFHQENMQMILHIENSGIAAPNDKVINDFVEELRGEGFDLELEEDFTKHSGIGIKENKDGTQTMTQKGLIDEKIKTAKMKDCNPNKTPALITVLESDADGEQWGQSQWDVSNNTQLGHHLCCQSRG